MFKQAKVGDKIWHMRHGWCTIIKVRIDTDYPIVFETDFTNGTCTLCGRENESDVRPTFFWRPPIISVFSRPKRIVKKTLEVWVNIYPGDRITGHDTQEIANKNASISRIACVHIVKDYEVEE